MHGLWPLNRARLSDLEFRHSLIFPLVFLAKTVELTQSVGRRTFSTTSFASSLLRRSCNSSFKASGRFSGNNWTSLMVF